MKAIIIGAGRGIRLMPTTADTPKCFAEVKGHRILDWALAAFRANGLDDIVFIGGYQINKVREAYPEFTFRHNADWENNNILASLFHAEDQMGDGFVCAYSDILFAPGAVECVLANAADSALVIDTEWLTHYAERSQHPSDDAEKVTVANGRITRIERCTPEAEAYGEYTGIAKFTADAAARLSEHYHRCREQFSGQPFREAKVFEKAYLIHLFQYMIEAGEEFAHADIPGGYREIDTQEDFELAQQNWPDN
jgi:choline kinase